MFVFVVVLLLLKLRGWGKGYWLCDAAYGPDLALSFSSKNNFMSQ